ncbi:MAG: TIGR02266 family protein [Deltaproteobacteria bacterium]
MGSERRQFPRVPLNVLVQYRFDSFDDFTAEYAEDLSMGGMFIRTDDTREVGTHIYLQFMLQGGRRLVEALGRVARVIPGDDGGMGIQFVNLDEDSKVLLAQIISEKKPLPDPTAG